MSHWIERLVARGDVPWSKRAGVAVWTCAKGRILIMTDTLYGVRLYAWYIIEIETFLPGEIEGTLMTKPFEFHGPFEGSDEAYKLLDTLVD